MGCYPSFKLIKNSKTMNFYFKQSWKCKWNYSILSLTCRNWCLYPTKFSFSAIVQHPKIVNLYPFCYFWGYLKKALILKSNILNLKRIRESLLPAASWFSSLISCKQTAETAALEWQLRTYRPRTLPPPLLPRLALGTSEVKFLPRIFLKNIWQKLHSAVVF